MSQEGIGLIVLLLMVVVAVAVFLLTGIPYNKYEYLEKEKLTLQYGVSESWRKQKKHLREPTGSA